MNINECIIALKEALAGKPGELDAWLEVTDEDTLKLAIKYLLGEQDQKTRHACAEAVGDITGSVVTVPEGRSSPYVHQITAARVCRETSAI